MFFAVREMIVVGEEEGAREKGRKGEMEEVGEREREEGT